MSRDKGLWVVQDRHGQQWLCPRRPSVMGTGMVAGVAIGWYWTMTVGGMVLSVCESNGCVLLVEEDRLDGCCFAGRGAKRAFRVGVKLA